MDPVEPAPARVVERGHTPLGKEEMSPVQQAEPLLLLLASGTAVASVAARAEPHYCFRKGDRAGWQPQEPELDVQQ